MGQVHYRSSIGDNVSMKAKIVLGLFTGLAVIWALAVISATGSWEPWKAWGLALLGGLSISGIGLRMHHLIKRRLIHKKQSGSGT